MFIFLFRKVTFHHFENKMVRYHHMMDPHHFEFLQTILLPGFLVRLQKKFRARVHSILIPATFHIASLNCYTPKFSGEPKMLTWYNFVGVQHPRKSACLKNCPLFWCFLFFFVDKIEFPDQTVNYCL